MPPSGPPLLVLAPHLVYPARNGSDLSLERLARHLSRHVAYVDLLAADRRCRYEQGAATEEEPFDNRFRRKPVAALRTLLRQSHFYLEKFLTPSFQAAAHRLLQDPAYQVVLHSYITTATLVSAGRAQDPRHHLIWTHNDEFKWFEDLQATTANPLGQYVARLSNRWLHRFFQQHQHDFMFLHVTSADQAGFATYYPDHQSAVVPIGVDEVEVLPPPLPGPLSPLRLTFVGTLGVKMNLDALQHFADRFYPTLRAHFGDALVMRAVGSRPSRSVEALCAGQGWELYADVSEEHLAALLAETTFTVLPFGYATGAKLKLLKSLAHGVPYLGTTHVQAQGHDAPAPCLLSDDPAAWANRLAEVQQAGLTAATRAHLAAVAAQHSWAASARRLLSSLAELSS